VQHNGVQAVHHVGGRVPLVSRAPAILTIHDLQPLDMPENFSRTKRAFLGRALPRSASRAAMITTPSEFVRRGVVSRFGIDEDRVVAVPAPVRLDKHREGAHARSHATGGDNVSPYFVYPAITYAHKNHGVLLEAFAQLVRDRPDVRLVLTGGEGPSELAVRADIARLGIQGKVVRTGRIPRDELDALVEGARAVVFPSRYEGFGLPVLEAMASGCPVIAADATALPEVVGDGGQLVGPDDVEGWRVAMARALDDDFVRSGEPGRRQAAGYSEAESVALLLGVYRQALRERARVV
jgi:alpha-1,3-rhamnosyl/mannosyltransferase